MSKKRIGIDCRMYSSSFTGIGRYVHELVQNLQKLDSHNEYFLFFNSPAYYEAVIDAPNFHKVLVQSPYYSLSEQTVFLWELNSRKLDLMHFTHFNAPIFYRKPFIVTIHDLTLHFFPGRKKNTIIHRLAYQTCIGSVTKNARKIISVSANTKQDLEKILKVNPEKIEVVYEGINPEFKREEDQQKIKSVLQKYHINKPFLLYTGVWREHKNLKGLLEAYKILRETYRQDCQLVITGKTNNPYAEELFEAAAGLQEAGQVIFPGHVSEEELIVLLSAAAAYVFPSFYEGFGLPPLEAMACGTPVAVSNTSSIPEVCDKAAIYFDPYNPHDIAKQINLLLTDHALSERLISLGYKNIQQFSWYDMSKEILAAYHQTLSKK